MKVPPTNTAEAVNVHKVFWHSGSKVPTAMTAWAAAQTFLRGQADSERDAKATDSAAAEPRSDDSECNAYHSPNAFEDSHPTAAACSAAWGARAAARSSPAISGASVFSLG